MNHKHKPLFLQNSDKKSIIVFIHGFMGSPRQFDFLAQAVYARGYSAYVTLLPGHGSTFKSFFSSTMEMWQNHVNEEIARVAIGYDNVFLVGHSMGCLLALNYAAKHETHISGLFLIACPMVLNVLSVQAIKVRKTQLFGPKSHPVKAAYMASSSVPHKLTLAWLNVKPAAEFKKLTRLTKRNLKDVDVPVTAVWSSADELVSVGSRGILKAGLCRSEFDSMILKDSHHAYYPEHERIIIENALFSAFNIRENY